MNTNELERLAVVRKLVDKHLTQVVAAKHLGLTVRQVKRLVKKYKQYGAEGLVSKQRGQSSNHKFSDKKIEEIKRLVSLHYMDVLGSVIGGAASITLDM